MFRVFYRISEQRHPFGNVDNQIGTPWENLDNRKTFKNTLSVFDKNDIIAYCDNLGDDTYQYVKSFNINNTVRTNLGNVGSLDLIIKDIVTNYNDDDTIYIVEDDYLHLKDSKKIIEEGLEIADYVSLYDSLDKYINGGNNPLIVDGGEITRVKLTKSTHWKYTNATTGTFASKVKIFKRDFDLFKKYNNSSFKHMQDFAFFQELINTKRGTLINCIPGRAAHIGYEMPPFIDWFNFDKDYGIIE